MLAAHDSGASSAGASAQDPGDSSTGTSSICTDTVGGGSAFGCGFDGSFPKAVPHSKQNFAASGFSAAQLSQIFRDRTGASARAV